MQTTAQANTAPRRGRVVGLTLALLLQAGFVYALVTGLDIKGVIVALDPTEVFFPKDKVVAKPPPVNIKDVQPDDTKPLPPPSVVIETDDPKPPPPYYPPRTGNGPADHGAASIPATHTIPPYPPLAARLGQEGTVLLRLTISATGTVTDAVVIRSSGSEVLDAAAAAWVKAHWRYHPAVQGGAAVPSTGNVAVTFNLRNGG